MKLNNYYIENPTAPHTLETYLYCGIGLMTAALLMYYLWPEHASRKN